MRIFVTGATGFIGTELVKDLLAAGHQVRGLSRSESGAHALQAAGAEPLLGSFTDQDTLRKGATGMDAAIHLAFNHDDWSKFVESAQNEVQAIHTLGETLGAGKRLVVTSGIGMIAGQPGTVFTEADPSIDIASFPRRPEFAAQDVAAKQGVHASLVRLPQVHDTRKAGLVTYLADIARQKGVSAFVGEGTNRWAAGALHPVAHLYRLAVEAEPTPHPGQPVPTYHAVSEEGVALRDIAESVGRGLNLPIRSISPDEAQEHFGLFARFLSHDMPASSTWTQQTLHWDPTGPSLLDDLAKTQF